MSIELNEVPNNESIGWVDALISRLSANSIQLPRLTLDGGTVTGSLPALNITQTWNNGGVTFTGLKANVTNTASNAASLLLDLQVGGSSRFAVNITSGGLRLNGDSSDTLFRRSDVGMVIFHGQASTSTGIGSASYSPGVNLASAAQLAWTNDSPASTRDVVLARDAANTLAQRNGTNAQTFRVYGTTDGGSNYERLAISATPGTYTIATEKSGTGGFGTLAFVSNAGASMQMGSNIAITQFNTLTFNQNTLNGSTATSALDIRGTWNTTGTPTLIKANVTDTASNAASLLLDLQTGGTSRLAVRKNGNVILNLSNFTGIDFDTTGTAALQYATGDLFLRARSTNVARISGLSSNGDFTLRSTGTLCWNDGTNIHSGSPDLFLVRDAANTLALRNGANAQTVRVYGTYTDASNYTRLAISGNRIASEASGTGSLQVTANAPMLDLAQTWNNAAVTFTGLKANVTDTASNAASLLLDLQVGGTSRFNIKKDGSGFFSKGLVGGNDEMLLSFGVDNTGIVTRYSHIGFAIGGAYAAAFSSTSATTRGVLSIVDGTIDLQNNTGGFGVKITRDAANTLALRNGTNNQTFNIYNTYTDASNYERVRLAWASNICYLETQNAGTGTLRALHVKSNRSSLELSDADGTFLKWSSSYVFVGSSEIIIEATTTRIGKALQFTEQTAPSAPATNAVRIYAEDNGSGKTRLMALFNTGAAQQIAIEP